MSDSKKTTVLMAGEQVPILVSRQPARGVITITSYANLVSGTDDSVSVGATDFTFQTGAVTPGEATARASTDNATTAASLAAQINAHATAGALVVASAVGAVVTLTAKSNTTSGDTIGMVYTDNDSNIGLTVSGASFTDSDDTPDFIAIGAHVYISDDTGKADDPKSLSTISNAIYVSGLLTGIDEDGNSVLAAIVDITGGL